MALSGGIKQEISLTGDEEVRRQFQAIGDAGKEALGRVDEAVAGQNGSISLFESGLGRIRSAFATVGSATEPFRAGLEDLRERGVRFGEALGQTADSVLPHWKTVLELTIAAGIVEFAHLVESAAKAVDGIGDSAAALGVTVERYQELALSAESAGIDVQRFGTVFARLSQTVEKEAASQVGAMKEIGKALLDTGDKAGGLISILGKVSGAGADLAPTIVRGITAADKVKSLTKELQNEKIGGFQKADIEQTQRELADATARATNPVQGKLVNLGDTTSETAKQLKGLADLMQGAFKQVGITAGLDDIQRGLVRLANSAGETGVKWRDTFRKFGADIKPQTLDEVLGRLDDTLEQKLGKIVPIFERTEDGIRKRRLDEIFLDLADKIAAMKNPTDQVTTAVQLFGARVGSRLVPMLKEGRKGILDVGEAFTKAGLAFSLADTQLGGKLREAIDVLETALSNAKNLFILAFAPVIIPLIEAITDAIRENAHELREWSAGFAASFKPAVDDFIKLINGANADQLETTWVRDAVFLFQGLQLVLKGLSLAFHGLAAAVDFVLGPIQLLLGSDVSGEAIVIAAAIFKLIGGFRLLGAFASVLTGVFTRLLIPLGTFIVGLIGWPATIALAGAALVAWLLTLKPVQDALAAVGNALKSFISYLTGSADPALTDHGNTISGRVSSAWKDLGSLLQSVGGWFAVVKDAVGGALRGALIGATAFLSGPYMSAWNGAISVVGDALSRLQDFGSYLTGTLAGAITVLAGMLAGTFVSGWNSAVAAMTVVWGWLTKLATDIMGWVSQAFTAFSGLLSGTVDTALSSLQTSLAGAWDWLTKLATDAMGWVSEAFNSLASLLTGPVVDAWNAVADVLQSVVGWFKSVVSAAAAAASAAADSVASSPLGGAVGMSTGGGVPGSGRGDKVPALLEPGEFVARLHAVRTIGAGVFAAMNAFPERFRNLRSLSAGGFQRFSLGGLVDRLAEPLVPVARLAGGGLVAQAGDGGRSAFTLVLGSKTFRLSGASDTVEELGRHARTSRLLSAGRAPSFVG